MKQTLAFSLSTCLLVSTALVCAEAGEVSPLSVEAPLDIETGLVAHWMFDEAGGTTAADSSGEEHHGTLENGPLFTEGKIKNAVEFDGEDDVVTVEPFDVIGGGITLAAWIKPDDFDINDGRIISKANEWDENTHWWMLSTIDPQLLRFRLKTDDGQATTTLIASSGTLMTGEWQHVAATWDGSTMRLYRNGEEVGSTAKGGVAVATDTSVKVAIGSQPPDAYATDPSHVVKYFDGLIDDARVYNRALTQEEIRDELMTWVGLESTAGPDWVGVAGETVTFYGAGPVDTASFSWKQTGGQEHFEPSLQPSADDAEVWFDTPEVEVGYVLTFELTVVSESEGTVTDEVQAFVYAPNAPKVAPGNVRALPMDFGAPGLGFRLVWDAVFDAESYQLALKLGDQYFWLYTTTDTFYDFSGMFEGQDQTVAVRGKNDYPGDGVPSQDVTYKAMLNVAPVASTTFDFRGNPVPGLNDGATDDHNHSNDGLYKSEDCWGYLWAGPLFFDHLVYHTGQFAAAGGWFTSFKVQVTQDGTTWTDVPGMTISPDYDFTDDRAGREDFTRYDISIPPTRGSGLRISGTPGGMNTYTSIAELEVFGDQTRPGDFILAYGVDGEVPEGAVGTLDGTASFSLAGDIVSYAWSGPVPITGADKAIASFNADYVDADTELVFSLTVEDSIGQTATDDDVRITVKNVVTTANAGPDQQAVEGTEVTLDASGSLTTTGTISYLWTQTQGTIVGVTGSTTETVTFTTPILWDYTEELAFQLDVNDGAGGTGTDQVVILVRNSLAWPAYPLTQAPSTYYFQDMLHLGQYPTDRLTNPHDWGNITSGYDPLAPFGGAPYLNPVPGEAYDFSGTNVTVTRNPLVWTPDHADNGMFLYNSGDPPSELQSYYHIYIISPGDMDVRWHRRHDDEIRGWNNGVLIFSDDSWDNNAERTQDGFAAQGTGLSKGLNSLTFMFEEGTGGNWIAVGVTDLNDQPFDGLYYSLGPSFLLDDAYVSRDLPDSYEPGESLNVKLSVRVNPDNPPPEVNIMEQFPGGDAFWTLTGPQVKTTTITYSVNVPAEMTQGLSFAGTVAFRTGTRDVYGDTLVYAVPLAPGYLEAEMLAAAHLSWSAPPQVGIRGYTIYRSVNGGAWEEIATTTDTTYVDKWVAPGENYSYQVSATNVPGVEGPASAPTPQASLPVMLIREMEDYDYREGGVRKYPGYDGCPAANEAPSAGDLGPEYDFYHPDDGCGAADQTYRPDDTVGIEVDVAEADNPTETHTDIGCVQGGSWYRYTFNVTEAGWIKLSFRVAAALNQMAVAAYWDEELIGIASAAGTGNWHIFTWVALEDQIQTTTGEHTLRVEVVDADPNIHDINLDKFAIGWDWSAPPRKILWEDDFEDYTTTQEVIDNGGWQIINGSTDPDTGDPAPTADGAWKLWHVDTPLSGFTNIAGMGGNFMVSNSDDSGAGFLLNEELISPEIDCSGWTKLRLVFNKNYRIYDDPDHLQNADVDIRVFDNVTGWSDWLILFHLDTTSVPAGLDPPMLSGAELLDLSAYDDNKIQLRWRYYDAEFDYWFAADNLVVSGIQPAPPPTKIIGWTYDGTNVSISWEAFGDGTYYVEYTTDLTSGVWDTVAGPLTETTWSTEMPGDAVGFARIRSAAP